MEGIAKNLPDYYRYLEDIRQRVRTLVLVFIAFFFVGLFASGQILQFIIRVFTLSNADIVTTSPFQFLDLAMSVGVYTALIVCFPIFIYQFYCFLRDGLNEGEKKFFFILLPISIFLFVVGFLYSFAILYYTLDSIAAFNVSLGIKNLWDINKFLSQIIVTSALLGIIFQYPIILTFLVKVGMLSVRFLRQKRRHAIALMFILTSLLPPTDGLSLIVMVLPLIIIYEVTIWANFFLERKKRLSGAVSVQE
jgi:sec-independent protein translocase protein TatC